MSSIGQVDVAAVRARHRIEDVVANAGIELRASGRGYLGCCPFHDDTTASLSVGGVPDRFHCFGCGATGDVIDFIGRLHHVGFRDAVALLDRTATSRVRLARPRPVTPTPPVPEVAPERAFAINALAWEHYTRPVAHQTAISYLARRRGIDLTDAETQLGRPLVGYAGSGWANVVDHLRGHGVTDAEMLALDLAHPTRRGTLIDTLRSRLIVPVTDTHGRITGFVGRDSSGTIAAPKYRNPTRTAVFDKSTALYQPAPVIRGDATAVVVEGPLDALAITAAAATAGRADELAPCSTLGGAVSEIQARAVASLTTGPIVLALDGDDAGHQAAVRWVDRVCREQRQPVLVTDLPPGADPASLLANHGAQALAAFLPTQDQLSPGAGWSAPRQPGPEILHAAVATRRGRPIDRVIDTLTPLLHVFPPADQHALVRSVETEMTRQGWNPHGLVSPVLYHALSQAGLAPTPEPITPATRELL